MKSPIYSVSGRYPAQGVAAAVFGGAILGFVWGLVSWQLAGGLGFISFFAGAGLGYLFTRLMELTMNRKRGPVVAGLAMGGIVLAFGIQFAIAGQLLLGSAIALGVALYFAYQNLRQL